MAASQDKSLDGLFSLLNNKSRLEDICSKPNPFGLTSNDVDGLYASITNLIQIINSSPDLLDRIVSRPESVSKTSQKKSQKNPKEIELVALDPPEFVSKQVQTLANQPGDQLGYFTLQHDNQTKTISSRRLGLDEEPNFENWNGSSIGNMYMIATYHHDSDTRESSWKLLINYFQWKGDI